MPFPRGRHRKNSKEAIKDTVENESNKASDDSQNSNSKKQMQRESNTHQANHGQRGRPKKAARNYRKQQQSPGGTSRSPKRTLSSPKRTPSKRRQREEEIALQQLQRIQAESFIMKLFDRSLDLSKYSECTGLYPICRAWMANQPRNPNIQCSKPPPDPVQRKHNGAEILAKLQSGELTEVTVMPAPEQTDVPKIPPPLDAKVETEKELLQIENATTKDEILALHINKWKRVKSHWLYHTKLYERRFEPSHLIIQELFKP